MGAKQSKRKRKENKQSAISSTPKRPYEKDTFIKLLNTLRTELQKIKKHFPEFIGVQEDTASDNETHSDIIWDFCSKYEGTDDEKVTKIAYGVSDAGDKADNITANIKALSTLLNTIVSNLSKNENAKKKSVLIQALASRNKLLDAEFTLRQVEVNPKSRAKKTRAQRLQDKGIIIPARPKRSPATVPTTGTSGDGGGGGGGPKNR